MGLPDDGLFGFTTRRSWAHRIASLLKGRFRNLKARFPGFVILSLACHLLVFGLLAIYPYATQRSGGRPQVGRNREAIERAAKSLRLDAQENEALREALAQMDDDFYEYVLEHSPQLDPRLGERERTEIFRSLMRASLGRLKERRSGLSALDFPPWGLTSGADPQGPIKTETGDTLYPLDTSPGGGPVLYRAGPEALSKLASLRSENEGPIKGDHSGQVEIPMDTGFARVPDEYYFRSCPYEGMMALGASVFFAVAGFPKLEPPPESSWGGVADSSARPRNSPGAAGPPDTIKIVYMPSSSKPAGPAAAEKLPDLPGLSETNIPKILDDLMELDDISRMVCSATDCTSAPGVLVTSSPAAVARALSIFSCPTPKRASTPPAGSAR